MSLPKFEVYFCLAVYASLLCYGIVQMYALRDEILAKAQLKFGSGWKWVGRPQDNTDGDLEIFRDCLLKTGHWYGIHLIACELCRVYKPQLKTITHLTIGLLFVVLNFHSHSVFLILLELSSFYLASKTCSKTLLWIVAFGWMCGINLLQDNKSMLSTLGPQEHRSLSVCLAWSVLKSLSFGLTKCKSRQKENFSLTNFLGYALYFPMFMFGPIMIFERYVACTKKVETELSQRDRYALLLKRLAKVFLWFFALQFTLHFVYIHYLQVDLNVIKLLGNREALYMFGYYMGQFFYMHFLITYGLGIAFASFDGMHPPNQPKCIGYVHRYSNMWKYFDQGLYEFLFKHIYCELCSKGSSVARKISASFGTFFFVYFWHGYSLNILKWSILNVCCLIMEKFLQIGLRTEWYKKNIARRLGLRNQQRLYALVGSQIFVPSAFSNFYFFAGNHVGDYFMKLSYWSGVDRYLWITAYCYCIFQSSEYVGNLRRPKK